MLMGVVGQLPIDGAGGARIIPRRVGAFVYGGGALLKLTPEEYPFMFHLRKSFKPLLLLLAVLCTALPPRLAAAASSAPPPPLRLDVSQLAHLTAAPGETVEKVIELPIDPNLPPEATIARIRMSITNETVIPAAPQWTNDGLCTITMRADNPFGQQIAGYTGYLDFYWDGERAWLGAFRGARMDPPFAGAYGWSLVPGSVDPHSNPCVLCSPAEGSHRAEWSHPWALPLRLSNNAVGHPNGGCSW